VSRQAAAASRHLQAGQLRAGAVQRGGGGGEAPPQGLPAVALDQGAPCAVRPRCAGLQSAMPRVMSSSAGPQGSPHCRCHVVKYLRHLEAAQAGLLLRLIMCEATQGCLQTPCTSVAVVSQESKGRTEPHLHSGIQRLPECAAQTRRLVGRLQRHRCVVARPLAVCSRQQGL
jgi:hypothetical protein